MNRLITTTGAVVLSVLLGGCTMVPRQSAVVDPQAGMRFASHDAAVAVATDTDSCRAQLGRNMPDGEASLAGYQLSLMSWNIKKASLDYWDIDLARLAADRDLVLLQEAVLRQDLISQLGDQHYWAFSPGYHNKSDQTGVLTLSRSAPLTHCNLTHREPWLGTPKATIVTEYAIDGGRGTVLVVNVHAINFTFGTSDFAGQLHDVNRLLADHTGPIILSGDFNTWRPRRMRILEDMTAALDLEPLVFDVDHRKKVFGQQLDHIYVRGFSGQSANTETVLTSDHNPLAAELVL